MRTVLTVLQDTSLINRLKIVLSDKTVEYFYINTGEEAIDIFENNEIACVVMDYRQPVLSGDELCELFLSLNPKVEIIILFDEKDSIKVIKTYNKFHVSKLIYKGASFVELIPENIESCLYSYNKEEELKKIDENIKANEEKYRRPFLEITDILNDKAIGYKRIEKCFLECVEYYLKDNKLLVDRISDFSERAVKEYVDIFLLEKYTATDFKAVILEEFNNPENKQFLNVLCDSFVPLVKDKKVCAVLKIIGSVFDMFTRAYRGKIEIKQKDDETEVNSLFEIREIEGVSSEIIVNILNNILPVFCDGIKHGRKGLVIQYKVIISNYEN